MAQYHRKTAEKENQRSYTDGAFERALDLHRDRRAEIEFARRSLKLDTMSTVQLRALEFLLDALA